MKQIIGDILEIESGYICHQVSCQGTLTKGSSLRLAKQCPDVVPRLKALCDDYQDSPTMLLGKVLYVETYNQVAEKYISIAFLFGQLTWGVKQRLTDYQALKRGFDNINHLAGLTKSPVYVPYKIGCNNAGGSWPVVKEIIEQHCPQAIIVKPER